MIRHPTLYCGIRVDHLQETDLFTFAHFQKISRACESGTTRRQHADPAHGDFNHVALVGTDVPDMSTAIALRAFLLMPSASVPLAAFFVAVGSLIF
jgi:hypothetical protein